MTCKKTEQLLVDYHNNALDVVAQTAVEQHLKDCKNCRQTLEEFTILFDTINQIQHELPDNDLELRFEDMLAQEKMTLKTSKTVALKPIQKRFMSVLQIAAVILLMLSSYFYGSYKDNANKVKELAGLTQEKTQMQTVATLSLMENESASKRLQAVSLAKDLAKPNNDILNVLIAKMNKDKHVNVRLAAANALAKFAENPDVRQALIKTLETEQNANMQIELIQILVDIEEKRVIPSIKKLLENTEIPNYIKDQINSELKQII